MRVGQSRKLSGKDGPELRTRWRKKSQKGKSVSKGLEARHYSGKGAQAVMQQVGKTGALEGP